MASAGTPALWASQSAAASDDVGPLSGQHGVSAPPSAHTGS